MVGSQNETQKTHCQTTRGRSRQGSAFTTLTPTSTDRVVPRARTAGGLRGIGSDPNHELNHGVVHAAGSYKDPDDWYTDALTNCVGGANIIQASVKNNVERFLYFQTSLCYGLKPSENPITLNHPNYHANSSYSITKTTNEDFLEYSGLNYVTFRLANCIGPRNVSGPLPIFYDRLSNRKQCFVSEARRDFVHVNDVVDAIIKSLLSKNSKGEIINIGSGKPKKIRYLINKVKKILKTGLPQFGELKLRKDEILKLYPSIEKAKKIIKWSPKVDFEKGLKSTIEYYKHCNENRY